MDEYGEPALKSNFAPRTLAMWIGTVLMVSGTMACGGGPSSGSLHDGAGMNVPAPTAEEGDAGTDGAGGELVLPNPGLDCSNPEQGCPCDSAGETVGCHAPVLRDGNYVTCVGTRACTGGVWGPCWPPTYQATTSAHRR
jgi:hypothetical protein